ncbi:hypothetical protein LCGC14_0196450 [marine sediment metagenome]|uniref:Uncharacterized protein n=1 Tax=marine sediment metagenome TaxID=412755 RepID=A0A0F9V2A1_9ZZZZ
MTKKRKGVWFPDGPHLSQVDTLSGLTEAPSEKPYDYYEGNPISIGKTISCDCIQFALQRKVSYGSSLLDKADYCECEHTKKSHEHGKGKCLKQWIKKE